MPSTSKYRATNIPTRSIAVIKGYPGGFRELSFKELQQKAPAKVIELAVWGMVPHNRLGRRQIRKPLGLHGNEHPHAAQKAG
ncbi:MAG: uL13 family ribosomal protein [Vampirovibrionales bacterium]